MRALVVALLLLLPVSAFAQADTEQLQINVSILPPPVAGAGVEKRCTQLGYGGMPNGGTGCVCSEPLQMTTWDNGVPIPATLINTPGGTHDPDDSPNSTECRRMAPPNVDVRLLGHAIFDQEYESPPPSPRPGFLLASPATEPLPPGNTVSVVFGRNGQQETWVASYHSYLYRETANLTYCQRMHSRWGLDSPQAIFGWEGATGSQQYKVQTLGCSADGTQTGGGPLQVGTETPAACVAGTNAGAACTSHTQCPGSICKSQGRITVRFDCSAFNSGGFGPGMPNGANFHECRSQFCRFEQCIDHRPDGYLRHRVQITVLPVANAAAWPEAMPPHKYTSYYPYGETPHPENWPYGGDIGTPVHFYNGIRSKTIPPFPTRMAAYAMSAKQRPWNGDFWIGRADEFGTTAENATPLVNVGGPYKGVGTSFNTQVTATDTDGPSALTYEWDPAGEIVSLPGGGTASNECADVANRTALNTTITRRDTSNATCIILHTVKDGYNTVTSLLKVTW